MATSMEADSEVHFKEKREGKGVKTETAVDSRGRRHPPGSGAPRRGRRGTPKDRAEEIQPSAWEV